MNKKLPNNPLKDKIDSIHYEFEESHWDNLASQLHAEAGGKGERESKNNKAFWYFGALLLCLGIAGVYYLLNADKNTIPDLKNPVVESSISIDQLTLKEELNNSSVNIEVNSNSNSESESESDVSLNRSQNAKAELEKQAVPIIGVKPGKGRGNIDENFVTEYKKGIESTPFEEPIEETNISNTFPEKSIVPISETVEEFKQAKENKSTLLRETDLLENKIDFISYENDVLRPLKLSKGIVWPRAKRKLRFGFLTGFNFSNGKPGLTFGLSIERRLKPQWYLELDLVYRGSHIDRWEIDPMNLINYDGRNYTESINLLKYTDLPLLVKWRPKQQLTIYAGPKVGFLNSANGKVNFEYIIKDDPVNPIVEQRVGQRTVDIYEIRSLRSIEFGAVFGLVYHLDQNIGIGLRTHLGLTKFSGPLTVGASPQKRNKDLQFLVHLYF